MNLFVCFIGVTVITIGVIIIGVVLFVWGNNSCNAQRACVGITLLLGSLPLGLLCIGLYAGSEMEKITVIASEISEEILCEIEENADDYTFYLDGEEVSYDAIDIRQYSISVTEEENKVFLTKKTGGSKRTSFFPVFIPW